MSDPWAWYLAGAGLWMFYAGIAYAFTFDGQRTAFARAFFAFPVWPVAFLALLVFAVRKLWRDADWRASASHAEPRKEEA
jgi:hypothetical protein